jgi:NADH:ubiquinone oxidoreductase subunit 5 (subunit L)/multisubunit Na+/H+ antiporter MnhA subunit
MLVLAAFLTAFYMFRAIFTAFFGEPAPPGRGPRARRGRTTPPR